MEYIKLKKKIIDIRRSKRFYRKNIKKKFSYLYIFY
jgi:hypothetical protein